jgi:formate dehydrogenase assembly factor FdhD
MTIKTLIAKPVVKNQFWIVTDGKEKVGNVLADGSGFEVKLNGNKSHYKNTTAIKRKTNIEFETVQKADKTKHDLPFKVYPTTSKVFNSMLDIKRKLHLFTTGTKSKCYHAAGWFVLQQGIEKTAVFCPKYIFIQRYPYSGPFKTEDEAKSMINN